MIDVMDVILDGFLNLVPPSNERILHLGHRGPGRRNPHIRYHGGELFSWRGWYDKAGSWQSFTLNEMRDKLCEGIETQEDLDAAIWLEKFLLDLMEGGKER
jgi:hypothetical protein